MARKRLPPLPFLPNYAGDPAIHADRLNKAINQLYRHLAEQQDDLILTATDSTQLPAASAGGRFAVIGTDVYVDATGSSWLKITGGGGGVGTYTDEVVTGTIDSSNLIFTILHTPLHGGVLTVNEAVMLPGTHYSRTGTTITFVSGQAPDPGDIVRYRYYY